jgi:hypothetical protein
MKANPKTSTRKSKAPKAEPVERNGWLVPQTATTAAKALGIDPKTMVKLLRDAGHEVAQYATFALKDVVTASMGDLERERTRLTRAEANIKEMEEALKRGDLVPMEEAKAMVQAANMPVRQRLDNAASELAPLVNPSDPEHARAQIEQWIEKTLRLITEQLPHPDHPPGPGQKVRLVKKAKKKKPPTRKAKSK